MATGHTGGCMCGAIRVETVGEPTEVVYCHCSDCRASNGAPISLFAGSRAEQDIQIPMSVHRLGMENGYVEFWYGILAGSEATEEGEEPMGKRHSYEPGTFCWVDLATTDPEGARSFYTGFFGWKSEVAQGESGGMYALMNLDGDEICGLYELDEERREQDVPSHWLSYVSVESADATVSKARELGGEVYGEPSESYAGARTAVVVDPAGASLAVCQPGTWPGAGRVNDVGCMSWNELQTRDFEAAGDFYSGLFGWEIEPIEDEGSVVYTTVKNGDNQNGGFMPMAEQHGDAPSFWLPYFTVSSRDGAMQKAGNLGGTVLAGPLDLPAGKIAVLGDPQGAAFAIFEGETDE